MISLLQSLLVLKKGLVVSLHLSVGIGDGLAGGAAAADNDDDGGDAAEREDDGDDDGDGVGTLLGRGESVSEVGTDINFGVVGANLTILGSLSLSIGHHTVKITEILGSNEVEHGGEEEEKIGAHL